AYLACRVLVRSHFGRVLVAIRENEDRARFLGYDVQRYKMGVCLISALLTGLAGALYPGRAAYATPDPLHWSVSGEFIIMVMLEVERVSKSFGALAALVDVSLTVRAGEVFSVIGPNGAGKSTLFNVIAGLHAPTRGRIVFRGGEITALGPEVINRRGLAKTF